MNLLQKGILLLRLNWHRDHWSREQLEAHQERQRNALLSYLRRHAPFYHTATSFFDLPVIDKKQFMEHFDEINTVGLQRETLRGFALKQQRANQIDLYENAYSIGLSSGTSGNVTITVLNEHEREQYGVMLLARSGIRHYTKKPRILFLLRRNNAAFMEVRRHGVEIIYGDYTVPVPKLIEQINAHRLTVIAGPPSLLQHIAAQRDRITHPILALVSYAEVLTPTVRRRLAQSFHAPVLEIYQGAEGFLAATCAKGRLHLNEDTTFFEFEGVQGEDDPVKRVIITDLYRKTLPFVRYSLHDLLELEQDACPCGSAFRIIKQIHGREDDIFILRDTNGNEQLLFPDYVRRSINQSSPAIEEFQALQHPDEHIEIRLVMQKGTARKDVEPTILDNLRFWAAQSNGMLPSVVFSDAKPERHPRSKKLIRVMRKRQ